MIQSFNRLLTFTNVQMCIFKMSFAHQYIWNSSFSYH